MDSGYSSADSSHESLHETLFTKRYLKFINQQLNHKSPQGKPALAHDRAPLAHADLHAEILQWCMLSLPSLFQETAFGLTGLVTIDMLSKLANTEKPNVDLIFIDTLHHFEETYDLTRRVQAKYPNVQLHVYSPKDASSADEFASKYGQKLWESNEELYDWTAKVEPSERAYRELGVHAVLTGRRRGQGGLRKNLDIIEVDDTGLVKVNPLANWTFQQVRDYVSENEVPYNVLLDRGYKSVGDWHSTQPVAEGEDERAGRWKGREKTECGIHNPKSRYAQFLMQQAKKEQEEAAIQGASA